MEDIFGGHNQEGHHTSVASPEGEGKEPKTVATEEAIINRGQSGSRRGVSQGKCAVDDAGEAQPLAEDSFSEEHLVTPVATTTSIVLDVS